MPKLFLNSKKCGGQSLLRADIMPPDRNSFRDTFDITVLDSQALGPSDGLNAVLRAVKSACNRGEEMTGMVAALNSRSYLFEYVLSGMLHGSTRLCPAL